jgi:hypothetical protein
MIECTKFKEYENGFLKGFADFYIDKWGVEINGCPVFEKDGREWINLPAKEYLNEAGEKKFASFMRFRDDELKKVFNENMLIALNKFKESGGEASFQQETFPF